MMVIRTRNSRFILPGILTLLLLASCAGGGGGLIRYYLVDPVDYVDVDRAAAKPLSVEIMDVHVPQYLERFNIVTRDADNRLSFAEFHQWGDNFRKNLLRTLARNLAILLGTDDIGTPINRSLSAPDYRIQVHIEQFERDVDGHVVLVGRWQVLPVSGHGAVTTHRTELRSSAGFGTDDYDNIVRSMRELYGEFSRRIAGSIITAVSEAG